MPGKSLSAADARRLFDYDATTGILSWKSRPLEEFATRRAANAWNAKYPGKAVGSLGNHGYRQVSINNKTYLVHRVIWLLTFGEIECQIDHISGDRTDNRLINLRPVTITENRRNACIPTTNTSGAIGVHLFKRTGQWTANIKVAGKPNHLGYFDSFDEAVKARKAAERKYGFHPNHGRPARQGRMVEGRAAA